MVSTGIGAPARKYIHKYHRGYATWPLSYAKIVLRVMTKLLIKKTLR